MTIKEIWKRLKGGALTMIFLAQQVLCCRQKHLHQLWDLTDDVDSTQRCLRGKRLVSKPFTPSELNVQLDTRLSCEAA